MVQIEGGVACAVVGRKGRGWVRRGMPSGRSRVGRQRRASGAPRRRLLKPLHCPDVLLFHFSSQLQGTHSTSTRLLLSNLPGQHRMLWRLIIVSRKIRLPDGLASIFFFLPGPQLTCYVARGSGRSRTLPVASYLRGSGWLIYLGRQLRHQLSRSLPYQRYGWEPENKIGTSEWPAKIARCPSLSPSPAGWLPACLPQSSAGDSVPFFST